MNVPFRGPGVYEIVSYQAPSLNANAWGGGPDAGQEVKLYPKSPAQQNARWVFALCSGGGEQAEYLLINVVSGYFLTATDKNKVTHVEHISPTDPKARWTLQQYTKQGQYTVYTINSASGNGQLNCSGGGTSVGTEVISYQIENTDNTMWYLDPY